MKISECSNSDPWLSGFQLVQMLYHWATGDLWKLKLLNWIDLTNMIHFGLFVSFSKCPLQSTDILRALSPARWRGLRDEPKERLWGRLSWTVVLKTFADIVNKPIKRNISITQTSPLEIPDLIYLITKSVKTSGKERWKFLFISSKFTFFLTMQQNGSSLQSPWFVVEILLC